MTPTLIENSAHDGSPESTLLTAPVPRTKLRPSRLERQFAGRPGRDFEGMSWDVCV